MTGRGGGFGRTALATAAAMIAVAGPGVTGAAADTPGATRDPLTLSAVRLDLRCLGTGAQAAPTLELSYALSRAAQVTFSLQRRTSSGAGTPGRCPKPIPGGTNGATYTAAGEATVEADAGPSAATVPPSGAIAPIVTPVSPAVSPSRTVTATRGRHRVDLLRTLRATRALAPGRYRLLAHAVASDGARSTTTTLWFWVLRPASRR